MTKEIRAQNYATVGGAQPLDRDEYDAYLQGEEDQMAEDTRWIKENIGAMEAAEFATAHS